MYTKLFIDIDDVISGMDDTDIQDLSKRMISNLDIEEVIKELHDNGCEDVDILNCLDWDETKKFVKDND